MPTADRMALISGLASALVRQYDINKEIVGGLNETINCFRETISLGSDGPLPANMMAHYGHALLLRYERNEDLADLDEAIVILQRNSSTKRILPRAILAPAWLGLFISSPQDAVRFRLGELLSGFPEWCNDGRFTAFATCLASERRWVFHIFEAQAHASQINVDYHD
jgi:hypothetical protein